jgi:transposase
MKRRIFTAEFKRSAVALVIDQNYTRQQAAENLGIGMSTLDNWLFQHRRSNGLAHTDEQVDLQKRYAELERENRRLTMERDILKKAAAYFAKDHL